MMTRREFTRTALAGAAWPALTRTARATSPLGGVRLGVQTYSFRAIARRGAANAIAVIVDAMKACGLDECELWSPQLEAPAPAPRDAAEQQNAREALRKWRTETGPGFYDAARRQFAAAGHTVYAYNLSFDDSFTDEEIARGFEGAKALGAQVITASTTLRVSRRLVPFAEKHAMPVAMHNHSNVKDPNEFATPASFEAALAMTPLFRVNLDIGHFTAANFDALAFLEAHHDRITNLHLKDRRRNQGENTPWGQGETPIRETLLWLRKRRSPIRAYVEYEYAGAGDPIAEVTACAAYATKVLTS
jgi:sugar phosphate isomerase/epimerase